LSPEGRLPCKMRYSQYLTAMADTAPTTSPETTPEKPGPAPDDFVAVIFDMATKKKTGSLFSVFFGGKDDSPIPSSIIIPGKPMKNEAGVLVLNRSEQIQLLYGANFNLPSNRWKELTDNPPSYLAEYVEGECFTVIRPSKKGEASGYHCFKEGDAISLISATITLTTLDTYGANETRNIIKLEIEKHRQLLEESLRSRRSA
jgi:hypothetical protein